MKQQAKRPLPKPRWCWTDPRYFNGPKAQPKQKQEKASDTAEERTKLEQAIADFVKPQEMQI